MGGLLLGFALGAMAFTQQGRNIGNKIGTTALTAAKKVINHAKENEPSKQSPGTSGDDSHCG